MLAVHKSLAISDDPMIFLKQILNNLICTLRAVGILQATEEYSSLTGIFESF